MSNREELPMFATFVTLAVIAVVVSALADMVRAEGAKIVAAIQGHSWASEPKPDRHVTVRFTPSYRAAEPVWPEMRAAA